MNTALPILLLFIGLLIGAVLGWLARDKSRAGAAHPSNSPTPELLDRQQQQLEQRHAAQLSQGLEPLHQAVAGLNEHLHAMENKSTGSMATLANQMQNLMRTSTRLSDRTDELVTALRSPNVRGRWGEMQLERVVELGGMVKHVDFEPQAHTTINGITVRPDLVIHLAGGRHIVLDSKVPFTSYLDALEARDPEEHAGYLRRHAHLLRNHVIALSQKDYIDAFYPTPEFVVLFVPADPFLDAALNVDPELLEFAFGRSVVIATPTTLFALLRTVGLGWQNEDVSEKAREIQRLGRELYNRLNTLGDHYNHVGRQLEKAVDAYNATLASMDSRVMVTARRLSEMDITTRTDKLPVDPYHVDSRPGKHSS